MRSGGRKKASPITGVLPGVVRGKGWEEKLDMHSFFPIWKKVVSENAVACSRPLKIVKDILWLEVENSTWMQQLQFEKMQLLDDINATLKISRIRDIKFVLALDDAEPQPKKKADIAFMPPDPDDLKKFEEQASAIEDEVIRESLIRLWYLTKACRRVTRE